MRPQIAAVLKNIEYEATLGDKAPIDGFLPLRFSRHCFHPRALAMITDGPNQLTLWSLFSLLGGTIISALVSYLLQRNSFAEARRLKAQDKQDTRKALALNLFHKMIRIASTLAILKAHLDTALAAVPPDQRLHNLWGRVQPIAAFADRVKFTPEELTFLMLLDKDLFNDLGPFDDIHNSLVDCFALYTTKRAALTDTLPATMTGLVGHVALDPSQAQTVAPRAAELDFLISAMVQRADKDSAEARELLDKLAAALNKEFSLNLKLERKLPTLQ